MRHFLTLCLWAAATVLLLGQSAEVTIEDNFDEQISHIFEHVNLGEASSGFLLDRGMRLANLANFNGVDTTANNLSDINLFGQVYGTLLSSNFNTAVQLPPPSSYMNTAKTITPESDTLPLVFLAWQYNHFDTNAVTNNLLSIQNGQLYDVPGRTQSPYLTSTMFVASFLEPEVKHAGVWFSFPTSLQYSNLGAGFASFQVDFGNGVLTALPGDIIEAQFPGGNDYDVYVVATLTNGAVLKSHTRIKVSNGGSNKFATAPNFTSTIAANSNHSGIIIDVFFNNCGTAPACPDPLVPCRLIRPLIIVDGFDPTNGRNYDNLIKRIGVEPFPDNPLTTLEDFIESGGYDLIFINYLDGADDMRRNGLAVRDAIKKINEWKNGNGSYEQNIIIGASMGGVTGKYAILKMEEEGYDYQTSQFYNLDGPMYGANLPLGVQMMMKHVMNISVYGNKLSDLVKQMDKAKAVLDRPATRQQLIYSVHDCPFEWNMQCSDIVDAEHTNFYQEFHSMGTTGNGLIHKCEYIGLCNGAINGHRQQYSDGSNVLAGARMFRVHGNLAGNLGALDEISDFWGGAIGTFAFLLGTQVSVDFSVWTVPSNSSSFERVYHGDIFGSVFYIPAFYTKCRRFKVQMQQPGGLRGFV